MAELCDRTDQTNPVLCANLTPLTISFAEARFHSDMPGLPPEFTADTGDVRVVTADLASGQNSPSLDMCRLVGKPIRATEVTFSGKAWTFVDGNRRDIDLPVGHYLASQFGKQFFQGIYRIGWKPKPPSPSATRDSLPTLEPLFEEVTS